MAVIYTGQSGQPLSFGNVIYNGTFTELKLAGSQQTLYRWFNTTGFERDSGKQLGSNLRAFPSVRADGINLWDLAAHGRVDVGRAEVRVIHEPLCFSAQL